MADRPSRPGRPPVIAIGGPSGVGKTRLLLRLLAALGARGLRVGVLKHTRHRHPFDRRGKDTERARRAGAVAAAIQGPHGMALFGPPRPGLRALAALLPACHLVLAEGFRDEPVARIEVHRRRISRRFLCATDRRVFAVVGDEPPPRRVAWFRDDEAEALASLIVRRIRARHPRSRRRPSGAPTSRRASGR
jgi:molybdopterin-guanine dinucleotide biosynthesis protein B